MAARTPLASSERRALIVLTGAIVSFLVLVAAYWAQAVLIPFVFAVLLTFILSPVVRRLHNVGLGRVPAVAVVILGVAGLMIGFGWIVTSQITGLLQELPEHTSNIKAKIRSFQEFGTRTSRLENMVEDIAQEVRGKSETPGPPRPREAPSREALPWFSNVFGYFGSALAILAGCLLSLVLTVFMLLNQESLRSRFLGLFGRTHLTRTTKAVDDATQRISQFLATQLMINSAFGALFACGLLLIGLPHALLWGVLIGVMRYVPYIGSWLIAIPLLILSLAMFPGPAEPLLVMALFLGLELVSSNFVEPRLFGKSIGVSEVALLVAAASWAFLWGPIGMVLSGPLTVCLVVLGKHVAQLSFLDVLLGANPVMVPDMCFYQRLLARDYDDAAALALKRAEEVRPEHIYDELLIPALRHVKRDRARNELTADDEHAIHQAIRNIVAKLREARARREQPGPAGPVPSKVCLLTYAAHDEADALALDMFRDLFNATEWDVEAVATEMPADALAGLLSATKPAVLCLGAVSAAGLPRIRSICERLREKTPHAKIVVGYWGARNKSRRDFRKKAPVDAVYADLLDARDGLNAWPSHWDVDGRPMPQALASLAERAQPV